MKSCIRSIVVAVVALGTTAAVAQGAGPSALTETYQDWQVACSGQDQARRCAFSQTLRQQNGQRVLALELTPAKDGSLSGTLLLPFGLALDKGVTTALDEAAPGAPMAFKTCLPSGCVVPVTIAAAGVKGYRSAAKIKLNAIASDTGKMMSFSLSLNGFSPAHDRTMALLR